MSDPQHEPTMEEILASIRKIISEDGPEAPAIPPMQAAPSAPAPVEEPDVLELTQVVAAPTPVPAPPPAPEPQNDIVFENVTPAADPADIFSDHTRKAMDDAFAGIPDERAGSAPMRRVPPPLRRLTVRRWKAFSSAPCARASSRCCAAIFPTIPPR